MIVIHGLKNCDTCRKARKWFDEQHIAYEFRDLRADGLDPSALDRWIAAAGLETLLNRRGTTWRRLDESEKEDIGPDKAKALMLAHPALVKRPVIDTDSGVLVGWGPDQQRALGK